MARFTDSGVSLDIEFNQNSLNKAYKNLKDTISQANKGFSFNWNQQMDLAEIRKYGRKFAKEWKKAFGEAMDGKDVNNFIKGFDVALMESGEDAISALKKIKQMRRALLGKGEDNGGGLKSIIGNSKILGKIGGIFKGFFSRVTKGASSAGNSLKKFGLIALGVASAVAVLRKAFSFAKEGFGNLSKVNGETKQNIQNLQASILYLKNALGAVVAPIYNVIAPALSKMVDMFASAMNTVARFIGAITGKQTVFNAKKSFSGITDGANSAGSSLGKASENAEELKRQLMGFDQIEKLEDATKNIGNTSGGSGGGGSAVDYGSMFEEVKTEGKSVFEAFFDPFKNAWESKGKTVTESFQNALTNIKSLATTVGSSFWSVWQNGTGQKTIEHILGILDGILKTFGNLAKAFEKGWKTGDVGTKIIQGLWDILNDVLGTIEDVAQATADWAKNLNFAPILTAFDGVLKAVRPVVDKITGALAWAYENVLLPFGKWTIEEAFPRVLDIVSSAFGVLNTVLDAIKPILQWVWDKFLAPIAEWTGGVITTVLDAIATGFDAIGTAVETVVTWVTEAIDAVKKFLGLDDETNQKNKEIVDNFNEKTSNLYQGQSDGEGYYTPDGLWVSTAPKTQKVTIDAQYTTGSKDRVDNTNKVAGTKTANLDAKYYNDAAKDRINATNKTNGTKTAIIVSAYKRNQDADRVNATNKMNGTKYTAIQTGYKRNQDADRVNAVNKMNGTKYTAIQTGYKRNQDADRVSAVNNMNGTKYATIQISKITGTTKSISNAVARLFGLAEGGAFFGGSWHKIPQFAGGGFPTHGTAFIAGERGPEVVGHIGGRSEVLNASQLASAVASGVGNAFSRLTIKMPNIAPQLAFLSSQQQQVATRQEQDNQGIINLLSQILVAIVEKDTDVYFDRNKVTNEIVKEINRRTRLTGVSELIY